MTTTATRATTTTDHKPLSTGLSSSSGEDPIFTFRIGAKLYPLLWSALEKHNSSFLFIAASWAVQKQGKFETEIDCDIDTFEIIYVYLKTSRVILPFDPRLISNSLKLEQIRAELDFRGLEHANALLMQQYFSQNLLGLTEPLVNVPDRMTCVPVDQKVFEFKSIDTSDMELIMSSWKRKTEISSKTRRSSSSSSELVPLFDKSGKLDVPKTSFPRYNSLKKGDSMNNRVAPCGPQGLGLVKSSKQMVSTYDEFMANMNAYSMGIVGALAKRLGVNNRTTTNQKGDHQATLVLAGGAVLACLQQWPQKIPVPRGTRALYALAQHQRSSSSFTTLSVEQMFAHQLLTGAPIPLPNSLLSPKNHDEKRGVTASKSVPAASNDEDVFKRVCDPKVILKHMAPTLKYDTSPFLNLHERKVDHARRIAIHHHPHQIIDFPQVQLPQVQLPQVQLPQVQLQQILGKFVRLPPVVPDVGAIGQVHTIGSIGKEKETEKVDVQNLDPFAQEAFQLLHELKHLESSSSSSQNQKIEDDKEKEEEEEKEEQGNETPNSVSEEEEDGNETPDSVSEEDDDNNEEEEEEEKNDMFLRLARVSGRKYATKFSGYPDLRPEQIQQLSLCAAMSSTCAHLWHDNGQLLEDHHKDIWRQDDNKEEPQEGTFPNFHGNENGMQPDFASWRSGDLDFFLVCETQEEAEQQLLLFEEVIRSQVVQTPQIKPIFARSKFAVSALLPTPYRTCQIVLRIYSSLEHVLVGFDWDVCQVGFYIDNNLNNSGSRCGPQGFGLANKNVWATPLGYRALHSGQMILDLSRQSETFESRGAKYVWRGYEVAIPTISIPQIQTLISWCKTHKTALLRGTIPVSGLLRLIMLIVLPKQDSETRSSDCDYGPLPGYDRLCRTLKKYEKNGMRFQSVVGYTLTSLMDTHEFVWNGKRFTTDVPAKLEIPFANSVGSFCPRFDSHWFDCFID